MLINPPAELVPIMCRSLLDGLCQGWIRIQQCGQPPTSGPGGHTKPLPDRVASHRVT